MSLGPGTHVGPYDLVSAVAHGGMGQVWRARDPRLAREVAIKVLPEAFGADPDRLARFERECQILASLSHPHIAIVHGLEGTPVGRALVMEFITGPTLAEMLAKGPLPVPEAAAIARDIASALEAAHDRGIVHRDLKPSNLKFSDTGEVKVLDFGLAKIEPAGAPPSDPDTVTAPPIDTGPGTVLGTAAYMSPEQARGGAVDRRTDIWALGCVLYEMLSGRRAFSGATTTDLLAAVIGGEPDWTALPPQTPAALRSLLAHCLRKDPRQRLRDIGDARIALDDVLAHREPEAAVASPARGALARRIAWTAALAAAIVLVAWGAWGRRFDGARGPVRKLEFSVREPVTTVFTRPRIAPDGSAVVYGGADRLWVRRLDELDARELPGSTGAEAPFWSSDSRSVAFARARTLWRVAAEGGEPVAICDLPATGRIISGAWRDDGSIVFAAWQQWLYEVPARGGDPRVLLTTDERREVDFHELCPVPGSRALLFASHERVGEQQDIELLSEGRRSVVLQARDNARYDNPRIALSGHLVYERIDSNQGVWAVPFSLSTLSVSGEPFRIAPGATAPSVSADGTLIYTTDSTRYELAWIDRAGRAAGRIGEARIELQQPALSPDGTRVVVAAAEETSLYDRDLWVFDASSGRQSRLQPGPTPTRDLMAAWLPDGTRVLYVQFRRDPPMLVTASLDDQRPPQDVMAVSGGATVSTDGRVIVVPRADATGRSSLWQTAMSPGQRAGDAARLGFDRENAVSPRLSFDGRLLAYVSDDSGQSEVYVRAYPGPGPRTQVSVDGGSSPGWSRTNEELYYPSGAGQLVSCRIGREGGSVRAAPPVQLFTEAATGAVLDRGWAVAADGRFLVVRRAEASHTGRITVIQNWAEEFRR